MHDFVRDNLVGGPSIIFHRHHKKGETRIRAREYVSESKVRGHILGVDAKSLYLQCMGEAHSTGNCAIVDREKFLYHYNHSKVSVSVKHLRVDCIVPKRRVVYQFHGCYWHGHKCHLNKQALSTQSGLTLMAERCTDTLRTTVYLELLEYTGITKQMSVVQISEKQRVKSTKSQWKLPTPDTSILMN